jgi:hypothetical protein
MVAHYRIARRSNRPVAAPALTDDAAPALTDDGSEAGPRAQRVWLAEHPRTKAVVVLTILLIIIVLLLLFGGWGYSRRGRRI